MIFRGLLPYRSSPIFSDFYPCFGHFVKNITKFFFKNFIFMHFATLLFYLDVLKY